MYLSPQHNYYHIYSVFMLFQFAQNFFDTCFSSETHVNIGFSNKLKEPPQKNKTEIQIQLTNIEKGKNKFQINSNATGYELKRYIFKNICDCLDEDKMNLKYENLQIINSKALSEYKVGAGQIMKLTQQKIHLFQVDRIRNIQINQNGIDPITEEKGVAKMPCTHVIGSDSMNDLIKFLIKSDRYQIKCPHVTQTNGNQEKCNELFDIETCYDIAILTKKQRNQYANAFSENWKKQFTRECPNNCGYSVQKDNLKINRVKCPVCKYGDYCFICGLKWKSDGRESCGNLSCNALNLYMQSLPLKVFRWKVDGIFKQFTLPAIRMCPTCRTVIEHNEGCKHMTCKKCQEGFCFICLRRKKDNGGRYPCGEAFSYCNAAEVQKIQNQQ